MAQLLFPDIAGQAQQGFLQGQQMRANRLIGAAIQNPDDAQGYLAQAGAINPQLAMGVQGEMQRQQAQQQATQQAQQTDMAKKVGAAARYYEMVKRTGTPEQIAAARQAIAPLMSQVSGQPFPSQPSPDEDVGLQKLIAQTAYLFPDDMKLQTVTPGAVQTRNGVPVFTNPAQPKITPQGYQAVLGPDGTYHAEPIPIQGAPNGMGMGQAVPGATPGFQGAATSPNGQDVRFNFPPGTPPEVIAAAKASAVANGDLAPGQQIGAAQPAAPQQPQTLAQVVAAGKAGTGTDLIAQRAQQIQELKARGVAMTPADEQAYLTTGKVDSGFNANSPAPIGDTSLKGPARLASIDPNDRATVLAVLQGRKAPPTGTASKSSYWMGIIQAANAIDPTFDETSWPARVKTAQAYAPSGPQGQQIIALNTLVNHVGELADQFKSLHNTGSPMYNTAANYLAYQTGLGAEGLPAYNINAHAAAQEIETLWKKGGGNEADIKRYSDALSSSNSPAQQQQVIQKMLKLAYGRLQSLQSNYQNSMGIAGHGLNFVNDKSEAVIQSLAPNLADEYQQGSTALPSGQIAAAQQPLQPQTAPSGPAPGTVEQGYRFKGGDPSNQANWEPVQ